MGEHSCILFQELGLGWHWLRSIAAHCVALTGGLQCFGSLSGSQPVFGVTGELRHCSTEKTRQWTKVNIATRPEAKGRPTMSCHQNPPIGTTFAFSALTEV